MMSSTFAEIVKTAYQYRLMPTLQQRTEMKRWLEMLRHQYNWMLSERFDWWNNNYCSIDVFSLVSCSLPELQNNPNYYSQKRDLVPLKKEYIWYRDIHSQVLQDMVKRVKKTFGRYQSEDSKRSGKPQYKGQGRYRTFTYPQAKADWLDKNRIYLPKLGEIKFIQHRPLPDGFEIKTASVTRKQWHYETAKEMLNKADVLFVEKLKVSNMSRRNKVKQDPGGTYLPNGQSAKSGLNESFADAGIAGFLFAPACQRRNEILPYKAAKAGKRIIQVNPSGTSQHCANCLNRVPKELSDRWYDCPYCGASMSRDVNSAVLIQKVGLGIRLTIKREFPKGRRSPRCTA